MAEPELTASRRASDADRDRTIEDLRAAYAAGRLDADELELRVQRAVVARTRADLRQLQADLPRRPSRRAVRRAHRLALRLHTQGYVATNVTALGVWAATGAGTFWPAAVIAPTSLLLAAHWRTVRRRLRPRR
ncbi:MAG TPA: DUF1707 domain-containing protein [Solirubrobacteraceae bacterium]